MDKKIKEYLSLIGKRGGKVKSKKKASAARSNGQKGGRPSTVGVRDWTKFFDAVDECRRKKTTAPLHALFIKTRITKERALINATARYLCVHEFNVPYSSWAVNSLWLKKPWFVANMESLKASAIVESPADFRANHIFVLENFLSRV